jgi:hypothetical protein
MLTDFAMDILIAPFGDLASTAITVNETDCQQGPGIVKIAS